MRRVISSVVVTSKRGRVASTVVAAVVVVGAVCAHTLHTLFSPVMVVPLPVSNVLKLSLPFDVT